MQQERTLWQVLLLPAVQNEVHVLFHRNMYSLRMKICNNQAKPVIALSVSPFCQSFSLEALYILHALPSQTLF